MKMASKAAFVVIVAAALCVWMRGPVNSAIAAGSTSKSSATTKSSKVVGLSIAVPNPDTKSGFSLVPVMGGVQVFVAIQAEKDKTIIALDDKASSIESFKDDKNTDLAIPNQTPLSPFGTVSDDGRTLIVTIQSEKLPAAGAKELTIKGKITAKVGVGSVESTTKDVDIKKGTKLTLGSVKAEITEASTDAGDTPQTQVTFTSNQSFEPIKKLTFKGADGKELEGTRTGTGSFGIDSKMTFTATYKINGKIDKTTIGVTSFKSVEKIEIPVNLSVGVGL